MIVANVQVIWKYRSPIVNTILVRNRVAVRNVVASETMTIYIINLYQYVFKLSIGFIIDSNSDYRN